VFWSGSNITPAGIYTPSTVGNHTLTYSFTNAFGCTSSDTKSITVNATTYANAGADINLCEGSANSTLIPVTGGGTWSGSTFVTPSGVFTPTQNGSYTLTYSLGNGSCLTTDQKVVNVLRHTSCQCRNGWRCLCR
jgi:hypothetical protein